jgi:predicted Rossmann fold flavoprotein
MSEPSQPIALADVAVIGGGPAGLMAAIAVAEAGAKVVVLEQLDRPGAKLLASGGGRCNLTNTLRPAPFMDCFGRQGRFMQPALQMLGSAALRRFFDSLGVATHAPDGFHVYPVSNSAVSVQSALWRRVKELGAAVRLGERVTGLWIESGALQGVLTAGGRVAAPRVVLATGGRGYPSLGGSDGGYELARQAGHTMVEPATALVPLVAAERWPRRCAGVSVSPARIWIDLPRQSKAGLTGDVLFTHTGLSGPAALDLSGDVSVLLRRHKEVPLRMDLVPGTSAEDWLGRFDAWQERAGTRTMRLLLDQHLPRSLAAVACSLAGLHPDDRPSRVSRESRRALAGLLTALPLMITGTEGWDRAMVTRGGVSLKEVDPKTLAGKRLAGLYLAGEVLDLDGPSGGFNLQWAFASGHLAGKAIAESGSRRAD